MGFPIVDDYRIMYSYFVERGGPEYRASWNRPTLTAPRADLKGTNHMLTISASMVKLVTDDDLLRQGVQLREQGPDLQDPSVQAPSYTLIDDDAKNCRVIGEDEFNASYVDNNIVKCFLKDFSPFEETLDNEYLIVRYSNGTGISIQFGLIDSGPEVRAEEYVKTGGIIYPIDDTGAVQFNAVNTPTLVYSRQWVLDQWKKANDENLEMAELVNEFVKAGFDPVSNLDSVKTPSIISPGG